MLYSDPGTSSRETVAVYLPLFDLIKIGIFESDRDIRIIAANQAGREIAAHRDGVFISGDRLFVENRADQKQLRETLNRVLDAQDQNGPTIEAFNIRRPSGSPPYHSLIVGGGLERAFIIVSDDEHGFVPDSHWLESWFDLTPSEARLASLLAAGHGPEKIAKQMGIGIATVRTHLSRALEKTGTSRQAELVAKILRSGSLLGPVKV